MNRQVWRAVVATVLVLAVASLWSALPARLASRPAAQRDDGIAVRASMQTSRGTSMSEFTRQAEASTRQATLEIGQTLTELGNALGAMGARVPARLALNLAAAALALAGLALWLVPAPPRRRVFTLVARGVRPSRIARQTGLSRDAIRALLQVHPLERPAALSRQDLPAGKIVRRSRASRESTASRKALSPRGASALRRAMIRRHEGC